jgi:MoaA/NifB/PqqE/SkfB family radical SAM enzyme
MRDDRAAEVRRLVGGAQANTCYFRTAAGGDGRKALLQVTERCNLHCAHCFVSATRHGAVLSLEVIRDRVLPRLVAARVRRLTLTGGEPFVHP